MDAKRALYMFTYFSGLSSLYLMRVNGQSMGILEDLSRISLGKDPGISIILRNKNIKKMRKTGSISLSRY